MDIENYSFKNKNNFMLSGLRDLDPCLKEIKKISGLLLKRDVKDIWTLIEERRRRYLKNTYEFRNLYFWTNLKY